MKITSWNVNGIRAVQKKGFVDNIANINPDILCIQETKAQDNEVKTALSFFNNQYHIYCNSAEKKGYSGTALLSSYNPLSVKNGICIEEHDTEGRVITAEYPNFFLLTSYTPNAGQGLKRIEYKEKWNNDFLKYIQHLDTIKPVIICGDLNVAHQSIDLKNDKSNYNKTAGYTQIEIDGINNLLNAGFIDVFRHYNPEKIQYTYWSYRFNARAKNTGWRLDYFIVSQRIINKISNIETHQDIMGSDHCPISININF